MSEADLAEMETRFDPDVRRLIAEVRRLRAVNDAAVKEILRRDALLTKCGEDRSRYAALAVERAAAIETARAEARVAAIEEAAKTCEAMVIGGRAWTDDQAAAAGTLFSAAEEIRALAGRAGP